MDAIAALIDYAINLIDPSFAAIIHLFGASGSEPAANNRKDQRFETWFEGVVKWAVDEDVSRASSHAMLTFSSSKGKRQRRGQRQLGLCVHVWWLVATGLRLPMIWRARFLSTIHWPPSYQ